MKTYKTEGIALKSVKYGEADKIITFLTPTGIVAAVAKGVRRTGSKFSGRLEPGHDLDLIMACGRKLDTVTQVQVKKARPWLLSDYDKLRTAFAVLEMAEKFAVEQAIDDKILRLTQAGLDSLEGERRLDLLLLAFDLKMLKIAGFMPHFNRCIRCGRASETGWLVLAEGGLLCDSCHGGEKAAPIGAAETDLIRRLLLVKLAALDQIEVAEKVIVTVRSVIWKHIDYHVQARFRAREDTADVV